MEYIYKGECKGNNDNGCFLDSCGHDCGCFTREVVTSITLETYKELEENGVYIHYIPEHYNDGTNLNFSIEFRKYKTQTGWYNDNHEFGDVLDTMTSSILLAKWYLENPRRIELINGSITDPEHYQYGEDLMEFLNPIFKV
jgi:hypothetical protein